MIDYRLWIERELSDLIEALRRHTRLLRKSMSLVYEDGDLDYLGELASKFRLLVSSIGANKPLLLRLMREFNYNPIIRLDVPPLVNQEGQSVGDTITLDQYLRSNAANFQTDNGMKNISIDEYICLWANKYGSAHEDWTRSEDLIRLEHGASLATHLMRVGFGIKTGQSLHEYQMRVASEMVLSVCDLFLSFIDAKSEQEIELVNLQYLLGRNSKHPHYNIRYAILMAKEKRFARAKKIIRQIDAFEPSAEDDTSLFLLLQFYPLIDEHGAACSVAERLLDSPWFMSHHEGAWLVHFNYGCALTRQGQFNHAAHQLKKLARWRGVLPVDLLKADSDLEGLRKIPDVWGEILEALDAKD